MVGIGTGFNEEINRNLFSFLDLCYDGLIEKTTEEIDPSIGIALEFKELEQYKELLAKEHSLEGRATFYLIKFLEYCYKMMNDQKRGSIQGMVKEQQRDLLRFINKLEKSHKEKYGSIWDYL